MEYPGLFDANDAFSLSLIGKAVHHVLAISNFLISVDTKEQRSADLVSLTLDLMHSTEVIGPAPEVEDERSKASREQRATQYDLQNCEKEVIATKYHVNSRFVHYEDNTALEAKMLFVVNFVERGVKKLFPHVHNTLALHLVYGDHTRVLIKEFGRVVYLENEEGNTGCVGYVVNNKKPYSCNITLARNTFFNR